MITSKEFCDNDRARFALQSLIAFFNEDEKGCYPWPLSIGGPGYGQWGANSRVYTAHRVSYALHVGDVTDGMHVCHSCDNRRCIRPSHLFLGTPADNMHDKERKGRGTKPPTRRGPDNNKTKLTATDVLAIRRDYSLGQVTQYELASRYGVSQPAIQSIIKRRNWKHIP